MVKLSVFLVRHGLDEAASEPPLAIVPHMCSIHAPDAAFLKALEKRTDPALTKEGYQQVEDTLKALANAFRATGDKRKFAYYSEPFKKCTASAVMISVAGFEPQEFASWGLWTPDTAKAPTAIPIVVENALADSHRYIRQMGGYKLVVDGGILHCAAEFWNKGYRKDPIMAQVQDMKDVVQDRIKKWIQASIPTTDMGQYRFAADVQFLKFEKKGDPYSLSPMSLKFSLPTSLLKPNKFLDPHRAGTYHSKLPPLPESASQKALDRCVETARKCGCDTIIIMTSTDLIKELFDRIDVEIDAIEPGDIVSCSVKTKKDGLSWKVHSVAECAQFDVDDLPPYEGLIEPSKPPPEEWVKAMAEAGEEKWGLFPPPKPETVPPQYPKDIPPFSKCLESNPAKEKWAWVHQPIL